MEKPRIVTDNWAMTRTYIDSYGEELWLIEPNGGPWFAAIHVQPSGKLYLSSPMQNESKKSSSKRIIGYNVIVDALRQLSQRIYEERGVCCVIEIINFKGNRIKRQISIVQRSGYRQIDRIKLRNKPARIIFKYFPEKK